MLPNRWVLLGYQDHSVDEVAEVLRMYGDALLIDARMSPRSYDFSFTERELSHRFGGQYLHVPAWGNPHYRETAKPPAVQAFDGGLGYIDQVNQSASVAVVMCVCARLATCHRRLIGELLAGHGLQVEAHEWQAPVRYQQAPLFPLVPGWNDR
jgi:uncharacterized protein (DUF488 family)